MEFRIDSMSDLVQTAGLVDGVQIDCSIGPTSDSKKFQSRRYRVYKVRPQPSGMKYSYDVSCYYDKPEYFLKKQTLSNQGTSSDTIQQMIQSEGITADIDATQDHQVWRNTGLSKSAYIRKVMLSRMYSDDQSAYLYGYSSISDRIRIKNIAQILNNLEVVQFVNNFALASAGTPAALFHEYSAHMASGQSNAKTGGYGLNGYTFDLTQGASATNSGASVIVPTGDLNINGSLAGHATRFIYDSVDVGNTHDNYYKAKVQNARIISTYSNYLELLVPMNSGCDLLDPVSVKALTKINTSTVDTTISGKYICVGVDMLATYTQYVEKVYLARNNIDVQNFGNLLTAGLTNTIEQLVAEVFQL